MNLLPSDECAASKNGECFRHSPRGSVVLLLILLGVAIGGGWLWVTVDDTLLRVVAIVLFAPCLALGIFAAWECLRASLAKTNWVLRVAEDGLYINLRSYLNRKVPPSDVEVAHLGFAEVKFVHKTSVRSETKNTDGGTTIRHHRYLDIVLRHEETDVLKHALASHVAAVRQRKTRWHHHPVLLPNAGTVRIEWVGRGMTRCLEQFVKVEPPLKVQESDSDMEAAVISRVEKGNHIDAIRLVRLHYGMDMTEAETFVRQLSEKKGQ